VNCDIEFSPGPLVICGRHSHRSEPLIAVRKRRISAKAACSEAQMSWTSRVAHSLPVVCSFPQDATPPKASITDTPSAAARCRLAEYPRSEDSLSRRHRRRAQRFSRLKRSDAKPNHDLTGPSDLTIRAPRAAPTSVTAPDCRPYYEIRVWSVFAEGHHGRLLAQGWGCHALPAHIVPAISCPKAP